MIWFHLRMPSYKSSVLTELRKYSNWSIQYNAIQYNKTQYVTIIWYDTIRCSAIKYNITQRNAKQCNTIWVNSRSNLPHKTVFGILKPVTMIYLQLKIYPDLVKNKRWPSLIWWCIVKYLGSQNTNWGWDCHYNYQGQTIIYKQKIG